ncbi:outer membrane beta-barrel protein [Duganella sp. FT50W]|uniref:Outer membrane beta-barrel protein n=1 Tax=Duganella lactea TaxID=2692173 RepID=A0A6L8MDE8_9BURK|nr:porin family protein [Duganella lactea]MYM80887.1 outer membrane beta-barrel protein [Duganella lactea]
MKKFLCPTLIVVAASSLAHAEDFYLGANINQGSKGHLKYGDGVTSVERSANQRMLSAGVFVGYVLSPSWALEGGYRDQSGNSVFDLKPGYQIKTRTSMGYLAVRTTWRLDDNWSLYGKLGVGQGRFKASLGNTSQSAGDTVHKTGVYLGVGIAYMVGKDVALQLELEHTDQLKQQGLKATMDKLSLGVKVGF